MDQFDTLIGSSSQSQTDYVTWQCSQNEVLQALIADQNVSNQLRKILSYSADSLSKLHTPQASTKFMPSLASTSRPTSRTRPARRSKLVRPISGLPDNSKQAELIEIMKGVSERVDENARRAVGVGVNRKSRMSSVGPGVVAKGKVPKVNVLGPVKGKGKEKEGSIGYSITNESTSTVARNWSLPEMPTLAQDVSDVSMYTSNAMDVDISMICDDTQLADVSVEISSTKAGQSSSTPIEKPTSNMLTKPKPKPRLVAVSQSSKAEEIPLHFIPQSTSQPSSATPFNPTAHAVITRPTKTSKCSPTNPDISDITAAHPPHPRPLGMVRRTRTYPTSSQLTNGGELPTRQKGFKPPLLASSRSDEPRHTVQTSNVGSTNTRLVQPSIRTPNGVVGYDNKPSRGQGQAYADRDQMQNPNNSSSSTSSSHPLDRSLSSSTSTTPSSSAPSPNIINKGAQVGDKSSQSRSRMASGSGLVIVGGEPALRNVHHCPDNKPKNTGLQRKPSLAKVSPPPEGEIAIPSPDTDPDSSFGDMDTSYDMDALAETMRKVEEEWQGSFSSGSIF